MLIGSKYPKSVDIYFGNTITAAKLFSQLITGCRARLLHVTFQQTSIQKLGNRYTRPLGWNQRSCLPQLHLSNQ